jgi:hypothetical protein
MVARASRRTATSTKDSDRRRGPTARTDCVAAEYAGRSSSLRGRPMGRAPQSHGPWSGGGRRARRSRRNGRARKETARRGSFARRKESAHLPTDLGASKRRCERPTQKARRNSQSVIRDLARWLGNEVARACDIASTARPRLVCCRIHHGAECTRRGVPRGKAREQVTSRGRTEARRRRRHEAPRERVRWGRARHGPPRQRHRDAPPLRHRHERRPALRPSGTPPTPTASWSSRTAAGTATPRFTACSPRRSSHVASRA